MPTSQFVDFPDVFKAEQELIKARRASGPPRGGDPGLWGLALSGGGIRSAAFNLGLLQALGTEGVLERCDYLSTVSGGGYIGSCLSSLCAAPGVDVTPERFPLGFRPGDERPAVKHLRRHAQYLIPRHGLFRLDTWQLVAAYLGGLVLTLLTVGSVLAIVAAAGILLYPHLVNGARLLTGGAPLADPTEIWGRPREYAFQLLFPALLAGALWLVVVVWNALTGRWVQGRWTLQARSSRVRVQALALMATVALAAFGGLPFLFVEMQIQLDRLFAAGALSALVLTRIFNLGREATKLWDRFKGLVLKLGSATFVAAACVATMYGVWSYREYAGHLIVGCAGLLVVLWLLTDINRISMYYFYRDRLSEAFLIQPDPRDPARMENTDRLRLSSLAYTDARVPYHLLNATVNLPGSADPTLHGRKADFFLMSPLFCGAPATGYRSTATYERDRVNLATAMAVSGAAANPQHGYATNGALAFVMTLLNARLGVWAENPSYERALRPPPRAFWPWYLVQEMLSLMNEKRDLINVSDGGHIENLGVYELLKRRCSVIIASDAGADPDVTFGDLGNLVRKARIDLSAYVHLDPPQLAPLVPGPDRLVKAHVAVGRITYREPGGAESYGMIYYVKPGLTENDPVDLREYRARNKQFPHEPTTDQFFDEAQFESYRQLGYQAGKEVAGWPW